MFQILLASGAVADGSSSLAEGVRSLAATTFSTPQHLPLLADLDAMGIGIGAGIGLVVGFVIAFVVVKSMGAGGLKRAKDESEQVIAKAKSDAAEIVKKSEVDGKAEYLRIKETADMDVDTQRREMRENDQRACRLEERGYAGPEKLDYAFDQGKKPGEHRSRSLGRPQRQHGWEGKTTR